MMQHNRIFILIGLGVCVVLSVPLALMQMTDRINWNLYDFVIMGVLIFSFACIYILLARKFKKHTLALAVVLAIIYLYIWAELSVGIFTSLGS